MNITAADLAIDPTGTGELRNLAFSFVSDPALAGTDTIASIQAFSQTVPRNGLPALTIGSGTINGKTVLANVSITGGVPGYNYVVCCRVLTAGGQVLMAFVEIKTDGPGVTNQMGAPPVSIGGLTATVGGTGQFIIQAVVSNGLVQTVTASNSNTGAFTLSAAAGSGALAPLTLNTPSGSNPGLLIVENNLSSFDLVIAHAKPGTVAATFQTGTLFTATGIISSGLFAGTIDASGNLTITNFGLDHLNGIPTMITTVSDVLGPSIANELSTAYNAGTGAYFELNIDNAGLYIHTVEADGSHYWGVNSGHASLDVGLKRDSGGSLLIQNGAANNAMGSLKVGQILVQDFAGNNKGGILTDGSQRLVAGAGIHFDPVTPGTTVFLLYDAGTTTQFFFRDNTNGRMQQTWNIGTAGNATNVFLDNVTVTGASGQTSDVFVAASNTANIIEAKGNNTLGFFAATPVVQQSITGALSSVTDANAKAVLTSIINAGVALGLWTKNTT